MMKKSMLMIGVGVVMASGSAHAAVLGAPVSSTASSEFSGAFVGTNLFDASVSDSDIGVTAYGTADGQWAGSGVGPHTIFMDYGSSITATGVAYAQRAGDDPLLDKVSTIEFWFSNTDFGGVTPVTTPDAVATITNTGDTVLTEYALGGTFSGQYVAARVSTTATSGNPGGSELRMTFIPEPGSLALLGLAGLMVARRRRA
ncbi:PEP-CTERM sorting domain-containing protein [Phycisphaeraceae bacterium D3-23]